MWFVEQAFSAGFLSTIPLTHRLISPVTVYDVISIYWERLVHANLLLLLKTLNGFGKYVCQSG